MKKFLLLLAVAAFTFVANAAERTTIWKNDGSLGAISWSGAYRFGLEGHDGANECAATFDEATWNALMTETFYIAIEKTGAANVRITNGWWDATLGGTDYDWSSKLVDIDGVTVLEVNLSTDPDFVATLEQKHILFTGDAYTLLEIYTESEGDSTPAGNVVLWENDGSLGAISWNGTYRFGLEGHDSLNECAATFDEATWNTLMTETFYIAIEKTGAANVRITNGWWDATHGGTDYDWSSKLVDIDGVTVLEVNLSTDPDFVATLEQKHILFTGDAYKVLSIFTVGGADSLNKIAAESAAAVAYDLFGNAGATKGFMVKAGKKVYVK